MANGSAQRLDGVLMTDQRSASEAVMIMWLGATGDSALTPVLNRHVIFGVVRLFRAENGLNFDIGSPPVLKAPGGTVMARLEGSDLTDEMLNVLQRLRTKLKSREMADAGLWATLADQLSFHVFEKGDEPVGPGWTLDYAGRAYPVKAA